MGILKDHKSHYITLFFAHRKWLFSFLTSCFLISIFLFSQPSISFAQIDESFNIVEIIGKKDGLSSNKVSYVYRFKEGVMFIGTNSGVNIYDGYSFVLCNTNVNSLFRLCGNQITSILADKRGDVWVASNNGINRINGFSRVNIPYFNEGNKVFPPDRHGKKTTSWVTMTSDGQVWGVSNGRLYKMYTDSVELVLGDKLQEIRQLLSDASGNLYIDNGETLLIVDAEGEISFEIPIVHLPKIIANAETGVFNMQKDEQGKIITSIGYKKFHELTPTGKFIPISKEQSKLVKNITEIWTYIKRKETTFPYIYNYLEDAQGIQWIATSIGLFKITINKNHFRTLPALEKSSLRALYEHDNGLIYGGSYTPFSMFTYTQNTHQIKEIKDAKDVFFIERLNQDTLLLGTDGGGIALFSTSSNKIIKKGIGPTKLNNFYTAFFDDSDTIWFGGKASIFIAPLDNPLSLTKLPLQENDPLSKSQFFMQLEQAKDGTIWSASKEGIHQYKKGIGTIATYSNFSETDKQLLDGGYRQFVFDELDNLWVATEGGLNYIDTKIGKVTKVFTIKDGLPDNLIYSLILENDSTLWLGTHYGLSRFDTKTKVFTNFYEKDGIAHNEFNTNSYLKAKNGILYFGGINGLTIVDPTNLPNKNQEFTPFIGRYIKYDSQKGASSHFFDSSMGQPVKMSPTEKTIEFHLSSENFLNPRQNTYAYRLEGFETDWVSSGTQNVVRYTNLDQGKYTLKIKATNSEGLWSSSILNVPIIVKRPYYEQWWFGVLLTCLAMILIATGFLIYIRYERHNHNIRHRIATDLHDDVSNSLNNIKVIAKDLKNKSPNNIQEDLERIERMSSSAIGHVQDVVWSVDKELDTLEDLIFVMEDYLDDVVRAKKIPVVFEKKGLNMNNHLRILVRRNLLLIFKEAVSNAVKHTEITKLFLLVANQSKGFNMTITNEFNALKKAKVSTGKGLKNMKQRAAYINGKCNLTQNDDQFSVIINLNYKI